MTKNITKAQYRLALAKQINNRLHWERLTEESKLYCLSEADDIARNIKIKKEIA